MPVCRHFPTNEADAGTRTPDPITTRNARCVLQRSWLSQICSRNWLRVPRVCNRATYGRSRARSFSAGRSAAREVLDLAPMNDRQGLIHPDNTLLADELVGKLSLGIHSDEQQR
jgi:hypothetical protein